MGKMLGIITLVVVLAVGFYLYSNKGPADEGAKSAIESAEEMKDSLENKGLVSSIKDAMGMGTAMSCTYTYGENGQTYESTVTVQGEKFRSSATVGGVNSYALSDGTDQYMWTDGNKTGFKMSKACLEEMAKMATTGTQKPPVQDAREAFDAASNVKCSPAESIDLTIPKDVTFTDQCTQMKESLKMMEQYKDMMPSGSSPR